MIFSVSIVVRRISIAAGLLMAALFSSDARGDVIDIDLSAVDPQFYEVFQAAEALWESRIQNFSTDLPPAFLATLPKLRIICRTPLIDGPGGILGGASTKFIMEYQSAPGTTFNPIQRAFPVAVLLQIDSGDFPTNAEEETMFSETIIHEMGHALGIGSLWARNGLIGPLDGVGLTQYTGGKYALNTYRREADEPVAAFIPIMQFGGPGTVLAHWAEDDPSFFNQTFSGPFKKEMMTGFACDRNSSGDLVCPPKFVSETTWASLADMGWEVAGINDNDVDPPAPGTFVSKWPKITGIGNGPFAGTQIDIAPGVSLRAVDINVVRRAGKEDIQTDDDTVSTTEGSDPYGLRNQRWVK